MQQAKLVRMVKHTETQWNEKKQKHTTTDKSDNTTGRNKSKDIGEKNEDSKDTGTESSNANKRGPSKITKETSTNKSAKSAQGQINKIQKK